MREIGFSNPSHPIIAGILEYLKNGENFDGHFWHNTLKSNNEYPHAPWWHTESVSTCHNNYNPTACLAGFIIRFAARESTLYSIGCRIAEEAFEQLMSSERQNDMHTTACYVRLMQYMEEADNSNIFDLPALKTKLCEHVKISITSDIAGWKTSYICRPSQFFNTTSSIFYADNKDIAEYECEYIVKTQLDDGSWNILWEWSDYPNQWAISKNWWKSNGIILNLLYLSGFGRV